MPLVTEVRCVSVFVIQPLFNVFPYRKIHWLETPFESVFPLMPYYVLIYRDGSVEVEV